MKKIALVGFLTLLLFSCNKNQQAVKRLDGTWNATEFIEKEGGISINYMEASDYELKISFDNCKLKNDEFCTAIWSETEDGETDSDVYEYRVAGNANSLEFRDPNYPSNILLINIVELKSDYLNLEIIYESDYTASIKMEKE